MLRSRVLDPTLTDPLIDRVPVKPFDPIGSQMVAARSGGQGRPNAFPSTDVLSALSCAGSRLGRRSLALDRSEHGGSHSAGRNRAVRVTSRQCVAMVSACALLMSGSAVGAVEAPPPSVSRSCAGRAVGTSGERSAYVCEAAKRFDLPERLIRAVILVESGGNVHAVSAKGAMGLMQIMPATWQDLRIKHGFGRDPFNPRDNILAGAAYLGEMLDRFGPNGFLAAYNAGPQRYQEYLSKGRPLPRETIDYVAKLVLQIRGNVDIPLRSRGSGSRSSADRSQLFERGTDAMRDAALQAAGGVDAVGQKVFAEIRSAGTPSRIDSAANHLTALDPPSDTARKDARSALKTAADGLFIPRSPGVSQ
ncbi:lytic transglycosylase domain-containing protein [Mesorhizobium sp. WSM3224]|uniref:lytic transglycosylase domain-containing protein n=1 Tax=Mesorhizobium sp. WSM3224 TaxID=1040986 RepID=UPI0032AE8DF3